MELMLGNFVLIDGKPEKIDAIHLKKVGWHGRSDRLNWTRISQIKPIPISDEFFDYNVYHQKDNDLSITWYSDDSDEIIIKTGDTYMFDYTDESKRITIYSPIRYVSDFQNLLNICGIKKEIIVL